MNRTMGTFTRTMATPLAFACTVLVTGTVQASEDDVRKQMEAFIGAPAVESVTKTGYGGLYEVVLKNGQLVYTDATNSFILDGSIIETSSRQNITQARLNELSAIDFSSLPLDQAVKRVRGKGTRVIATFEDPNCGYCKRLGKELAEMDDVTVYTFLYPILSEDSAKKSDNIWCANDAAQAWTDWVVSGKVPTDAKCDTSAIARNVELGQSLRITGTPTIFLADGTRIGGYMPRVQLEQAIEDAER